MSRFFPFPYSLWSSLIWSGTQTHNQVESKICSSFHGFPLSREWQQFMNASRITFLCFVYPYSPLVIPDLIRDPDTQSGWDQNLQQLLWIPAFAGMTTIYECIKNYVPLFCVSIFPFVIPDLIRDPGEILKILFLKCSMHSLRAHVSTSSGQATPLRERFVEMSLI